MTKKKKNNNKKSYWEEEEEEEGQQEQQEQQEQQQELTTKKQQQHSDSKLQEPNKLGVCEPSMLGAREHSHPSKTDSYAGLIYELDHIAFEANQFQSAITVLDFNNSLVFLIYG